MTRAFERLKVYVVRPEDGSSHLGLFGAGIHSLDSFCVDETWGKYDAYENQA